jgi:N-acetylglucosamine-6-phosphate deacetylase
MVVPLGRRRSHTAGVPTRTIAATTVVTPEGLMEPGEVVVDEGRIVDVRPPRGAGSVPDRVLAPGFVDLQVNGHDDVNCATADGDQWHRMDQLLLAQGVTAWCPTLVTAPLERFASPLERIGAAMTTRGGGRGRPEILGVHLEGPFLGGAPGAHRREHVIPLDLEWLRWLPPIVRVVTLAPELDGAEEAIRLLTDKGVLVSLGHSTATYAQALDGAAAGARLVTHLFNGMGPLHHRTPGLLGAALADERLTPSLIADGVHVHPAALRAAARAKGRGGWVLVTDAVAWRDGRLEAGGERRVSIVEGAPRLADGTIAGSSLTMDAAVRRMVHEAGIPLADAVAAASATPAALLGRHDIGRLAPGARADLVVLSPDLQVEEVLLAAAG